MADAMPQTSPGSTKASAELDTIDEFLRRSPCPFARLADIVRPPVWTEAVATDERLDSLNGELRRSIESGRSDLAILELCGAGQISLAEGAGLVRAILAGLRDRDRDIDEPLLAGIEDPDWDFRFAGEALFISFFAPLYPHDHARFSGVVDTAFLLLQPERGFRRYGVSSNLPHRRALSGRVHDRFHRLGQHYNLRLNTDAPKSLRYVKPIGEEDEPVRWWDSTQAGERSVSSGRVEPR
jgi:hypothetical protein